MKNLQGLFISLLVIVSLTTLMIELSINNVLESTRTEAAVMYCEVHEVNLRTWLRALRNAKKHLSHYRRNRERNELATNE